MVFQHYVWYVAALPEQVDRQLRRRVILNEPVLLYRTEAGGIVGIKDRCPHRFAPLSRGKLHGDVVECGYHGLRFDGTGRCVLNPHHSANHPKNRVLSFPIKERYGFVWIWMGDPELANTDDIPDLSYMEAPGIRNVYGYMKGDYRYDILIDNLLDLTHADYLHVGSFSGGAAGGRSETKTFEKGNDVFVVLNQWDAAPAPTIAHLGGKVDQRFVIHWHPGQVITFEHKAAPAGQPLLDGRGFCFAHVATPETDGTTHYFMSIGRDANEDPETDKQAMIGMSAVIRTEDGPMLDAIDEEMGGKDLMAMRPVILPGDAGGLLVRSVMQRLIRAESRNPDSDTSPS